jgi:hypothetical protein
MAEWYLKQFAAYDTQTRVRHLDYFDVHYYQQGGDSPDVTRSLWDPTYTDPSWINDKIALIPRMRCWIDGHVPGLCPSSNGYYPGTKIALSEYNLSLSGVSAQVNAIIQGDTLGIFAREDVSLATRWGMSYDGSEITDAFLMYRDYDGAGGKFGDTWIDATSANLRRQVTATALGWSRRFRRSRVGTGVRLGERPTRGGSLMAWDVRIVGVGQRPGRFGRAIAWAIRFAQSGYADGPRPGGWLSGGTLAGRRGLISADAGPLTKSPVTPSRYRRATGVPRAATSARGGRRGRLGVLSSGACRSSRARSQGLRLDRARRTGPWQCARVRPRAVVSMRQRREAPTV